MTLVTFYHGGEPPRAFLRAVEELGVEVKYVPLKVLNASLRAMTSVFNNLPLEVAFYTQPEYRRIVNRLIDESEFDIAFAFFMRTAEYIKNKKIRKVLIAEDCRTIYQQRSYSESNNLIQKSVRFWEYLKLRKYEPEIVNHFDITTLVSNQDIAGMKQRNDKVNYRLLTNGVDLAKFKMNDEIENRNGMIFSGKLDIWANVLMVQTIIQKIFPIVKSRIPSASLRIVGSKPASEIISAAKSDKSIELISDVPDMVPYLQSASVFVHPHSGGSGIQNKLLEAMACGCPVVTTPTGNQGIDAENGKEILIAKSNEEMADYVVKYLSDNEFASLVAKNARSLIERTHSWYAVYDALDNIIDELTGTIDSNE